MSKTSKKGYFITVEGSDGVGKSTQIKNIEKYFRNIGSDVVLTREPGGTNIGEKLRSILLDVSNKEMDPLTEMLIYAASRAQHVKEVIIPALNEGKTVISDRYIDSSLAYQGYGRNLGRCVEDVNKYATDGIMPDKTFWLDLLPSLGRERIKNEELDRIELEKSEFHNNVRKGYEAIAKNDPKRVHRIDASLSEDEVWNQIRVILETI